jgi:transposase-like protein
MKLKVKKAVSYSKSDKNHVVYAVMREGFSIASICSQLGIDEPFRVREWIREEMRKRGIVRIPRTLIRRGKAPKVLISEPVNRQFQRYEEMLIYQESLIEALFEVADEETKKKLLKKLSPSQQRNLKRTGRLST